MMGKEIKLTEGTRFFNTRLTLIKEIEPEYVQYGKSKKLVKIRKVRCLCDCGDETITSLSRIRSGHTKSCGCYITAKKHGDSGTKLHNIWRFMIARCYRESHHAYSRYGGRGIKVVKQWHDYKTFKQWSLANKYQEGMTLEREHNNKPYKPSNCKWVHKHDPDQNQNKINSKWWVLFGVVYGSSFEAARELGIGQSTVVKYCKQKKLGCWSVLKYDGDIKIAKPVAATDTECYIINPLE